MSATQVIYKYEVGAYPNVIPAGAIVHVGSQEQPYREAPMIWVRHNLDEDGQINNSIKMAVKVVGTGETFEGDAYWIVPGSIQMKSAPIVLHVLQRILSPGEEI